MANFSPLNGFVQLEVPKPVDRSAGGIIVAAKVDKIVKAKVLQADKDGTVSNGDEVLVQSHLITEHDKKFWVLAENIDAIV